MASLREQPFSGQKKRKADVFSPSLKNRLVAVVSPQPQRSCREEPPLKRRKTAIGIPQFDSGVTSNVALVKNASSSESRHQRTLSALNVSSSKTKNVMHSKNMNNIASDCTGDNAGYVKERITKKQSLKNINKTLNKLHPNENKSKIPVSNAFRQDKNQSIGNVNLVSASLSKKKKVVQTKAILMKSKLDTVVKTLPSMQKGTKKQNSFTPAGVNKITCARSNIKIPNRNFNISLKTSVSSKKSCNVKALPSSSKVTHCRSIKKSPIKKGGMPKTLSKSVSGFGDSPLASALSPSPTRDSHIKNKSGFGSSALCKTSKQFGKHSSLKKKKFSEVLPTIFNFSETKTPVSSKPGIIKFSSETCVTEDENFLSNNLVDESRLENLENTSVVSAVGDKSTRKKITAFGNSSGSQAFFKKLHFLKNCNSMNNRKSKKKSLFKLHNESPPSSFNSLLNLTEMEGSSQVSHVHSGFENPLESCNSEIMDSEKASNISIVYPGRKSNNSIIDSASVSVPVKTPSQPTANESISVLKSEPRRKSIHNRKSNICDYESVKISTENTPVNKSFAKSHRKSVVSTPSIKSFYDISVHNDCSASKSETPSQFAEGFGSSLRNDAPSVSLRNSIRKSSFSVKENNFSSNTTHGSTSDNIFSPVTGSRTGSVKKSIKKHSLLNRPLKDCSVLLPSANIALSSQVSSEISDVKSRSGISSPYARGKSTGTVVSETVVEPQVDSEHLSTSGTVACLNNDVLLRKSGRKSINSLNDVRRTLQPQILPDSKIYSSDKKTASKSIEKYQRTITPVNDSINVSHAVSETGELNAVSSSSSSNTAATSMSTVKIRTSSRKSRKSISIFSVEENTSSKTSGVIPSSKICESINMSSANFIENPLISTSLNDSVDNSSSNSTVPEIISEMRDISKDESACAVVSPMKVSNRGSCRKSTGKSANAFVDVLIMTPKTPSSFTDNEVSSLVKNSIKRSVKPSQGSISPNNDSRDNSYSKSEVLEISDQFRKSLEEEFDDVSPKIISELGSTSRKSARKSVNSVIDFTPGREILPLPTNSASRSADFTRSSRTSARKINASFNESINNSSSSSIVSETSEIRDTSNIGSTSAVINSPMNVSNITSRCRKSTQKSGNSFKNEELTYCKTPSRLTPGNRICSSVLKSPLKSIKNSPESISSNNDSTDNSYSKSAVLEMSNQFTDSLEEELAELDCVSPTIISKLGSPSRKSARISSNSVINFTPGREILPLPTNSASRSSDVTRSSRTSARKINASLNESVNNSGSSSIVSETSKITDTSNIGPTSAVINSTMNVSNLASGSRKSTRKSSNLCNYEEMPSPEAPSRFTPDNTVCSSVNKSPVKSVKKSVGSVSSDNDSIDNSCLSSEALETSDQFRASLEESTGIKSMSSINSSSLVLSSRKSARKPVRSIDFVQSRHSMDFSVLKTPTLRTSARKAKSAHKHFPEIDFPLKKEKHLTEYKAKMAAKKLKLETPKSPDKKKMAALLVCHLKGRSSIKKKPLFSDIVKTKTVNKAKISDLRSEKYTVPSTPNVTRRRIKEKVLTSEKMKVPGRSVTGSTGHVNSPAPIIIRNKTTITPSVKKTRKGRKSVNFTTTCKPDVNDEDLLGVPNLFYTPAKFSDNYSKDVNSPSRIFLDALELSSDDVKLVKSPKSLRRKSARNCSPALSLAPAASSLDDPVLNVTVEEQTPKKLFKSDTEGKSSCVMDSSSNYGTANSSEGCTVSQFGEQLFYTPRLNKSVRFCESSRSSNEGSHLDDNCETDNSQLDTSVNSDIQSFVASSTKGSLRKTKSVSFMLDNSINFDDITYVKTPNLSVSVLVSPLSSNIKQDTTITDSNLCNIRSGKLAKNPRATINTGKLKRLQRTPKSPKCSYLDVEGVKRLLKTPRSKSNFTDLGGVKRLLRTPKSPKSSYLDVDGVKNLVSTPICSETLISSLSSNKKKYKTTSNDEQKNVVELQKIPKSPESKYLYVEGVKRLLKTPKSQSEFTDLVGVKRLLRTPRSPKSSYLDVDGVKNLVSTPICSETLVSSLSSNKKKVKTTSNSRQKNVVELQKITKSPESTYLDVEGVKRLFKTPKSQSNFTDLIGVKRLLRTPKSPKSNYLDVDGVKNLVSTPISSEARISSISSNQEDKAVSNDESRNVARLQKIPKIPESAYLEVKGVKRPLKTPDSKSNYTDLEGVQRLLRTPKSPKSSYLDVDGVKSLMSTPKSCYSDVSPLSLGREGKGGDINDLKGTTIGSTKGRLSSTNMMYQKTSESSKFVSLNVKGENYSKSSYLDVEGVRQLLRSPKRSQSSYLAVEGVKRIFQISPIPDYSDVDIADLFKTDQFGVPSCGSSEKSPLLKVDFLSSSGEHISKRSTRTKRKVNRKSDLDDSSDRLKTTILDKNIALESVSGISTRKKRGESNKMKAQTPEIINSRNISKSKTKVASKKSETNLETNLLKRSKRLQGGRPSVTPSTLIRKSRRSSGGAAIIVNKKRVQFKPKSKKSSTPKKKLSIVAVEDDNKIGGTRAYSKKTTTSQVGSTRSSRRGKRTSVTNMSSKSEIENEININPELTAVKDENPKQNKRTMRRRGVKAESLSVAPENEIKSAVKKNKNSSVEVVAGPSTQKDCAIDDKEIKAPKKSKVPLKAEDVEQESMTSEEELSGRRLRKTRNASTKKNAKTTSRQRVNSTDTSANETVSEGKLKPVDDDAAKSSKNSTRNVNAKDIEQDDKKPIKRPRKQKSNEILEGPTRSTRSRKCQAADQEVLEVPLSSETKVQRRRKRVESVDEDLSTSNKKRKISNANDSPKDKKPVRRLKEKALVAKTPPKRIFTRSQRGGKK